MKILNFGSCNLDYVYALNHIVASGETESSQGMQLFPGGKGLNQSIAATKAGVEVYHAGCVGEDGGPASPSDSAFSVLLRMTCNPETIPYSRNNLSSPRYPLHPAYLRGFGSHASPYPPR